MDVREKTVVYGDGWIGGILKNRYGFNVRAANIFDIHAILEDFHYYDPKYVINLVAKNGPTNIDWCEDHYREVFSVNSYGARILSHLCCSHGIQMVHVSSGCLWETGEDITENKAPQPISIYSQSKYFSELRLAGEPLILRPRLFFDYEPHMRNLITKLEKYDHILDIPNSMTYVGSFVRAMIHLMQGEYTGTFHVVNPGSATCVDIVKKVFPNKKYQVATMESLRRDGLIKADRSNVTLSTAKLQATGCLLIPVQEAINEAAKRYPVS